MADLYTHAFSDAYRLAKSKTLVGLADGTYNVLRLPRYAMVTGVHLRVEAALAGDTVEVGFSGNGESADDNYFLTTAQADASATGYKSSGLVKYFDNAGGAITFKVSSIGVGKCFVFVEYTVVH